MNCAMIGACEGPVRNVFTWATGPESIATERVCDGHAECLAQWLMREPWWVITYRAETLIH